MSTKQCEEWWKRSVVYQIYPRSFLDSDGDGIGDLQGIVSKLDYLHKLGIDVIWLSPIYDSPNDDNGYDIRDYHEIMQEFGTMDDFEYLLEEAHTRGMKIIMDLVVNHTSDEHKWFLESKKSKDQHYRDYYIWRSGENDKEPNNWGSVFGGPAWEYDEQTDEYYLHIFSRKQPDLNWENKNVRDEIYRMMAFWLNKGVDGFRMDVINFISKVPNLPDGIVREGMIYGDGSLYFMNGPRIHEFLKEMNSEVLSKYDTLTVGEMPGASTDDAILYTDPSNNELNMVFTFEHMELDSRSDKWDYQPLHLVDLKKNFEKWQTKLHNIGWNSLYWNNHDQPRIVSRFGNDEAFRIESAKMLATCLHMLQGTPYIYQGEEIGMTNVKFPSIEQYKDLETLNMFKEKQSQGVPVNQIMNSIYVKGRDNARTPMQWDDSKHGGFTEGEPWIEANPRYKEINVEAALFDDHSIFYHYQHLIALRKKYDVITGGNFTLLYEEDPNLFAYRRKSDTEELIVLCNFSEKDLSLRDPLLIEDLKQYRVIVQNYQEVVLAETLTLRPFEGLVFFR
ncbi:glycoside hydrolase family 13 protein [Pseudalkalibacillus berkeleyi]|uniref:oligo-1,6-glucosidase n=1 Tax=Pseudalkalibacillus berkeleyi TaxID=1069813 RepID=A0ABS9GZ36_9BACL|nr:alpha-glucosidase [Pseudalkalibacillus berkeleyi]MCF6138017.1 alpha-glucosidase [Pseudalkalibacillus berkeleyi]